jgi:hypothetical protein
MIDNPNAAATKASDLIRPTPLKMSDVNDEGKNWVTPTEDGDQVKNWVMSTEDWGCK